MYIHQSPQLQLSSKRFVNVRVFNGKVLVDIREYWYDDSGTRKPGKKGEEGGCGVGQCVYCKDTSYEKVCQ